MWPAWWLGRNLALHFLPMVTSSLPQPIRRVETDPAFLAEAFSSFTAAAASLERSYAQLQHEVAGLRRELERTNRDLMRSLEENQRMRERLKRILEALPCAVVTIEADGDVSLANPEAVRLLGMAARRENPPQLNEFFSHVPAAGCELEIIRGEETPVWIAMRRARLGREAGGTLIFIAEEISRAYAMKIEVVRPDVHEFIESLRKHHIVQSTQSTDSK